MKGKARKSRIAKMLAGRGLKPKGAGAGEHKLKRPAKPRSATKRAAKAQPSSNGKPGGAWASMTPEQRAERIAKMRAGKAKVASV